MKMNRRNFLKVAAILGGGAFASIFKLGNVWACEKTAVTESIFIPAQILEDMKQHARELAPQECCGILGGQECNVSEQYRITNVLATMTDQELSRFEG
ncbi:MAG: twin-arginine translocation signal domain-containing protein, partial [Nitrospira sp.]|nr:twin-arginine translocation signal domain-containing protein [Nitrospira sp.]